MRGQRRRLGQHFLNRQDIAQRIVSAADARPGENVIEIGPGRGILTRELLSAGTKVWAIELDPSLYEELLRQHPADVSSGSLKLVCSDFLKTNLEDFPRPAKFVSNLPYSTASLILQRILDWPGWSAAVLMFQKEVAERILAGPGGRNYGLLSLSAAIKAEARFVCDVPKTCFSPQPKVDSAVVRLDRLAKPVLPEGLGEDRFFAVARAAFAHRRKTLANSLARALDQPRARIEDALARAGVASGIRAERVPLESFIALARLL